MFFSIKKKFLIFSIYILFFLFFGIFSDIILCELELSEECDSEEKQKNKEDAPNLFERNAAYIAIFLAIYGPVAIFLGRCYFEYYYLGPR